MFLTLYLNAKLKAFADHASEFWVFIVTIMPLLLASLIGGSMYISYVCQASINPHSLRLLTRPDI